MNPKRLERFKIFIEFFIKKFNNTQAIDIIEAELEATTSKRRDIIVYKKLTKRNYERLRSKLIMITTSDIRKGLCIRYSNDIYKIIEFLHVKPGKGPAFVRTKLKSVSTGKVVDNTFTAGHKIDDVRVENRKYQFLYKDGETYHFMNNEDYNQIEVDKSQIESDVFLKEGLVVTIIVNSEKFKYFIC